MSRRAIRSAIKVYEVRVRDIPAEVNVALLDELEALACAALSLITRAAEARERSDEMLAALMAVDSPGAKASSLLLPELGKPGIPEAHWHNVAALRRAAHAVYA
jgi:hypothetical protein